MEAGACTCACGDAEASLTRICGACRRPRACVRCASCFALVPPGGSRCPSCAGVLELEPLLERTHAPCPRCAFALSALAISLPPAAPPGTPAPGPRASHEDDALRAEGARTGAGALSPGSLGECERCGGLFAPHATLAALVEARRPPPRTGVDPPRTSNHFTSSHPPPPGAPITYLRCPECAGTMNRKLFGRQSAVVVDTCKLHGTWFDRGKLTLALAFVALGGLEAPRASPVALARPLRMR